VPNPQPLFLNLTPADYAAMGCGVVCFVTGGVLGYKRRGWDVLSAPVLGYLAGAMAATYALIKAGYLVYCAFRPELLLEIKDLPLQIAIAGCSATFLALVSIKAALEKAQGEITPPPPDTSS
jgi:hypothetical protein